MRRRPWLLALFALAVSAWGCAGDDPAVERALHRLECLAFVPPGTCVLRPTPAVVVDCSTSVALLVDRYEATRGEWLRFLEEDPSGAPDWPRERGERWREGPLDLPATFMDREEAQRFAAWKGMRLMTATEWLRIAAGTRGQRYPWGFLPAEGIANTLEIGRRGPTAVGTFEEGASPAGVYDLVGNVWEWVEGRAPLPGDDPWDRRSWAMGGSYLSRLTELFGTDREGRARFFAMLLDPRHRAVDLGLRCGVEAEAFLRRHLDVFAAPEGDVRRRLVAVGKLWGREAVALLERLAGEPGASPALEALLEGARR